MRQSWTLLLCLPSLAELLLEARRGTYPYQDSGEYIYQDAALVTLGSMKPR